MNDLLNKYFLWLKDKTVLSDVNGWTEITTPYLDRHNDQLQIYAKELQGTIVLTDDGYTIHDLESSGCKMNTPRRKEMLRTILNGFGVQLDSDALVSKATPETFALKKHNLIQSMLAVNDLFYTSRSVVASLFFEDVQKWLDESHIRYTPQLKFTGKSGYDHIFDFVVPKSRLAPERILKVVNNPDRKSAEVLAFSWIDTLENRPAGSMAYGILNDTERPLGEDVNEALTRYNVMPLAWSKREEFIEALSA